MSAGEPGDESVAPLTYDAVGVRASHEEGAGGELGRWVARTFTFNEAVPRLPLGYFANVLPLSPTLGLAISTDGIGTKLLVAQDMGKFDTVGIDCVAMNANDVLCVGARPISMVDYIAVEVARAELLGQIAKGLCEGAHRAGINIPGGEVAQVREMVRGSRPGVGFDLVGTCVGTVHPDRLIVGQDVRPGDVVVGLASSGVHCNGFTLARRALFQRMQLTVSAYVPELGRTLGEELLQPTLIYVPEVLEMMAGKLALKALIHVTGDGFLNLLRVGNAGVGFVIDGLPEPPPVFALIQRGGNITDAEMFRVFNMGVGFCVVVPAGDADRVREIAESHGRRAARIGYVVADHERRVWIPERGICSRGMSFTPCDAAPPPCPG